MTNGPVLLVGNHTILGVLDAPLIVHGVGPTLPPKPAHFYFGFGAPISTAALTDEPDRGGAAWGLREQVAEAVTGQIAMLQVERERDPQRRFGARLRASLVRRTSGNPARVEPVD
ncbi:MAG: hypothetical protein ABI232_12260 [Jatrophihabitantaceae bacterium]